MNLKAMLFIALVVALSASAMAQIPDYNLPQNWMCHPVLKTTDVARQFDLKLSVLSSDTSHLFDTIYPGYTDTLVDIFYIYPTINMDKLPGNTAIDKIDTAVAQFVYREQAGIYAQYGRVFVPYYKQATIGVFLMHDLTEPKKLELADYFETAYKDVEAAFDNYLQNYNKGHKIILIGHSQGSDMMRFLLHRRFDNNPVLKSQLVVALSGGEPNYAATDGSRTGGSLEHIKTLDSSLPLESGCIISWRSWKNGYNVTPIDAASIFYNQNLVDKGLLYQTYDTVNNRHRDSNYDFGYTSNKLVTRYISMSPDSTQYWGFDDMFGARFISAVNKPGCTYLMIDIMPVPMDLRVIPNPFSISNDLSNPLYSLFPSIPIPDSSSFSSTIKYANTNYHCWDMQFVQGDLLNLLPELIAITYPGILCVNPASGGTIMANQSDCIPFDAAEITGLTQPDGYSGKLEYKWQISTDSIAFVTIDGVSSESYDPGLISGSTWYKRLVRVSCKTDWNDAAESNVVKMAIVPPAVEVTATAGNTTPTQYATLKSAFDNINNGIHRGAITVKIIGNTFEPATAVLYQSGHSPYLKFPKGSDYFSVNIYPVVTGLTISGNLNAPLIDLNGADNVTFNGSLNGLNAEKDLTIINTSFSDVAGTSTIRFINDAVADTVKYCTLKGSSNNANTGVVFFSTTNGTRGNDSIVILNNDITSPDPLNRPVNAIYSLGIQAVDMDNSANIISHNNIFDFANKSVVTVQHYTNGILLEGSNMDWKISDNSFYETGPYNTFEETTVTCINVASKSGNTVSISGNFIGGSGSECSGRWWDNADGNISFRGIALITGSSKASSIQGNTIRNFYNRSSNEVPWSGILIGNGDANIGTIAGNMIGDTTGTGSIIIESVLGGDSYAIFAIESENVRIENNTIGSFMILSDKEKTLNFTGIFSTSNGNTNTLIRNNQVGSLSDARNIQYFNPESYENQQLIGIFCEGSLSDSISGNIVSGLNSITSDTSANNESLLYGIVDFSYDASVISENRVSNLTTNSSLPGDAFFPSVSGIIAFANRTQTVSNNTITNLSNTNPDQLVSVKGLLLLKIAASEDTISGNYVGGLSIVSSNGASEVTGLSIEATMFNKKKSPLSNKLFADFQVNKLSKGSKSANGASTFTTVTNNIINVGDDFAYTYRIAGIYDSTPEYGSRYYFNTVNIGGYPSVGNSDSYAFYLADHSSERDIRNNILVNSRSNEDGFVKNYGLYFGESVPSTGNLALDYNDYYAPGTGGVLAYINGTAQDTLPLVAGQDANSLNIDPAFANAAGITAASLLPSTKTLVAVTGTGITTDYAGLNRSLLYPAMGAWEYDVSPCSNPTKGGIISGSQSGCSPFYPIVITSSELPSENSGSLEYQWQSSADSLLFTNLVEATSETYEPASLESTTWYKRLSRVDCMSNWTGAAGSNVVKIKVNSVPGKPAITLLGNTLTSDSETGNQWYLEGVAIEVATGSEYTAVADGNYTVVVTHNGCSSEASNTILFLPASVTDFEVSHSFDVYPNPGKGLFTIKITSEEPIELNIEIYNSTGILVWNQEKVSICDRMTIPVALNDAANGIYMVALRNSTTNMFRKVVIMK
jgi:hypothetical protein